MKSHIIWPPQMNGRLKSPFDRGRDERPLRLTFHLDSLWQASSSHGTALRILEELSVLNDLDVAWTDSAAPVRIELEDFDERGDTARWIYTNSWKNQVVNGVIRGLKTGWRAVVPTLMNENGAVTLTEGNSLYELLLAQAHLGAERDIFVTLAPCLLNYRTSDGLKRTNCRTPTETLKIVGLYLRTRNNFIYGLRSPNFVGSTNFDTFYFALARHRLPSMWTYFSTCVEASKQRNDDEILHLGQSILVRAQRSLEARDAIGEQFYHIQSHSTRDRMMYHFDYLLLLLSGVFDTLARIARLAYGITSVPEGSAGFQKTKKNFLKALQQQGASDLIEIVTEQRAQNVLSLLFELRNTVHGASLPTTTVGDSRQTWPDQSYIHVPSRYYQSLIKAVGQLGGDDHWGLLQEPASMLLIEPYSFACALVDECFSLIDAIAAKTSIGGLLVHNNWSFEPRNEPPDHFPFDSFTRQRFAALG